MSRLVWDSVGNRLFQAGVDRGVLYLSDDLGVVWNGLTAVEDRIDETTNPFYQDGIKYLDSESLGEFSAVLRAFTYPDEFEQFNGISEIGGGLFVYDQPTRRFGLSYRTRIGNDIEGTDHGYQIHILYNLIASNEPINFSTLSQQPTPIQFSWALFGTPVNISGFKPTSHVIVDSTEIDLELLETIEDILYGTDTTDPRLPTLEELGAISPVGTITIIDHGDGTWSAIGPDELITMLNSSTFQITEANAVYLDADTYQISDS